MDNNIINKYKNLIFKILKIVDPIDKPIGRSIKYNYDFCLKNIFIILKTGLSWINLSEIINYNLEAVRKRLNKWIKLGVFKSAHNILFKIYKNKYNLSNFYIDSTVIGNFNGSLNFGYNKKIQNKKSIKINAIVDDNKMPHLITVTSSSPHDAKIIEDMLNDKLNNYKQINIIGDKGYIKNIQYKNFIKDNYNINLITPNRINSINNTLNDNDKYLLNKRHIVENFFSLLKRSFLRILMIKDKK